MKYFQTIFRGIGQVMLQNNYFSGIVFLIGIFYNSWLLGLAAIMGTVISTVTAQILKYPKEVIENGIYGFNGTLVGIALFCFFDPSLITVLMLIIGATLSTPLNYYLKKLLPPFTASFVIITWFAIFILLHFFNENLPKSTTIEHSINLFSAGAKGFGQVMFQENTVTGILFFIAILINSKIAAGYAVYATLLGLLIGLLFSVPSSTINAGLMGYNGILCAIVLADYKRNSFLWITAAVVLSVLLTILFSKIEIIALTAPFVLSTSIILKLKGFLSSQKKQSKVG